MPSFSALSGFCSMLVQEVSFCIIDKSLLTIKHLKAS